MKKKRETKRSGQDVLQDAAVEKAAEAVLERLKSYLNPNRDKKINTLDMNAMRLLAGDAISAYVKARSAQAKENPDIFDTLTGNPDALVDDLPFDDPLPSHLLS